MFYNRRRLFDIEVGAMHHYFDSISSGKAFSGPR